jgi:REP element-mobilizing transposase RayT
MRISALKNAMETRKHPDRRSIRLPEFDYSGAGVYFITICADGKLPIFGNVIKGSIILNDVGVIAQNCWCSIPDHFPNANLYDYIVMPNHVHGLIALISDKKADTACRVPTAGDYNKESFSGPTNKSIPTIIRSYKSAVSKLAHEQFPGRFAKIWQSRYYEHVIRDDKQLVAAVNYIKANPSNWEAKRIGVS